jgi:hypothetical protein
MDPGIYLNLFRVEFIDSPTNLMVVSRSAFPKLKEFREMLRENSIAAEVFAVDDQVYGYGSQQDALVEFGFSTKSIQISAIPQLASRLVLDGFVAELQKAGYLLEWSKQGATVYQRNPPLLKLDTGLTIYRGFDIQSLYLNDPELDELFFAVVIDAAFTYRDADDQPLRPDVVKARFGEEAFNQLLVKQGDLTPQNKINLEVSRQHFTKLILPFVAQRGRFTLPCGIPATTSLEPIRVVLAGDEEEG